MATCWFLKFFDFVKFWCRNGRLKEGTLKKDHFRHNFFSNAHNLGPNWAFWTFSVLSTLVWSLAWWWAQKFLNFDLICARGSCLKSVPVNIFSRILSIHFQMTISQAWNGLFQKFQSLELIVLIVIFVDFTLACYQPNIQRCIMFTGTVTSTHSFLYLSCSGVSACLGWRTSCISLSTPFKFLIISFF